MVIEDYVKFGIPIVDLALQYGEQIALGLSGAGIYALLKN